MRTPVLIGAAVALLYSPPARRWYLTWGATDEEVDRVMPGDDLLPRPDMLTTRGITIAAAPEAIWPWLVQMGSGRGGAYTYDWIENLFGLDMHSADEILPEFQHIEVGDVLAVGPKGPRMQVEICDSGHVLCLRSQDGGWVWTFELRRVPTGTRLVSRNRIIDADGSWARRLVNRAVLEPGSLVMERRMLIGLRDRAETTAPVPPLPARDRAETTAPVPPDLQ